MLSSDIKTQEVGFWCQLRFAMKLFWGLVLDLLNGSRTICPQTVHPRAIRPQTIRLHGEFVP
jgi:hypothetical protein